MFKLEPSRSAILYNQFMRILAVSMLFTFALHAADRVTAIGSVVDQSNQPIENETVMVYSAGVKKGYDLFCPTCYIDCGKRAVTDEKGAFSIPGVSPDLVFNLLVVREGYGAAFIKKVDPANGPTPPAALKKRTSPEDPSQIVRGRVIDSKGQPVRDALIAQQGIIFFEGGRRFGDIDWLDLVAVSNREGEFEMAYSKPAKSMILQVAPRGMAPRLVTLPTGAARQAITVTDGATIRGRLVHNGKPVANVEFGLSTHSRMSGTIFQDVQIGTNQSGEFAITNVPPGRVWDLYAKMDALAPRGLAADVTYVATKDDGQDIDVGVIAAKPAYRLQGRILLSDGAAIPTGMRVSLFSDHIPDRQSFLLPPDVSFEFKGLAKGVYTLSPAVKSYQQQDLERQLELVIDGDRKDFNITLYPSKPPVR